MYRIRPAAFAAAALSALAVAILSAFAVPVASAQTPPLAQLPAITVTGNPLGSDLLDLVAPTSVLSGQLLQQRIEPTLGEMLSTMPGVNSSYYGPNASRPVIRGLDGDRIRILQNGAAPFDASGTSVDHAVSLDTLLIKRVEVVRGPASLLYGSSAIGGVVNVIDDRIPDARVDGASGKFDARYASASGERSGGVSLAAGTPEGLVLHADAFKTLTDDLRIPGFARSQRLRDLDPLPPDEEPRDRLPNSATDNHGGAVGASFVGDKGFAGASYSEFDSNYGTVAEEDVTIRLKQKRLDVAGELDDVGDALKSVKVRFSHSDYQHTEFEGAVPGTTFSNTGYEGRVDAVHNRIGPFDGAFGVQVINFDFSALGDEGFLPRTNTRSYAGFVFEQTKLGAWTLQFGGRIEGTRVHADDDPAFGPAATRDFTTGSFSLGALYQLSPDYVVALSAVSTQRPPNYQELYADGPHLATGIFEIGDRNLDVEKSVGIDLSLRRKSGPLTGSVGVFYNRFRNFITQYPNGLTDPAFGDIPIYTYSQTRAAFYGAEAQGRYEWSDVRGGKLGVEAQADWLKATDLGRNQPLPRMSPVRYGGALTYERDRCDTRLEVLRTQSQTRVAQGELPTDGYTMVNLAFNYRLTFDRLALSAFIKGSNLLNQEARDHVSFIKDIAPLAGRGVTLGLQGSF